MRRKYSKKELDYLRKIIKGKSRNEVFELFNKKFEPIKFSQFLSLLSNHKITNGISATFKKGNVPANKGTKGMSKANITSFKKGQLAHNTAEIGKEVVTSDGYLKIKVAPPNKWKYKHRLVWEQANGKVSKGTQIMFLDGDKLNCSIENLALVTMSEKLILNKRKLIHTNADLTSTGLNIAKLIDKVNKVKKVKKGDKK